MPRLRPSFSYAPVAEALELAGVAAEGPTRARLLARLLAADDEELAQLAGVAAADVVVVTGPGERLPWVDGAVYLRRVDAEPRLLLPTTARCSAPAPALCAALLRIAEGLQPPIVALPTTRQ
ncbi:MAG: hypothetical protein R3A51_22645, partial [Nannocystaceae bacterium]